MPDARTRTPETEPGSGEPPFPFARWSVRNRFSDSVNSAATPSFVRCVVLQASCALIHLANASYRLGRTLNFDPQRQECIQDDEANRMLTREYRPPFVVPSQV